MFRSKDYRIKQYLNDIQKYEKWGNRLAEQSWVHLFNFNAKLKQAVQTIKTAILQSQGRAARMISGTQLSLYFGVGLYVSANSREGTWETGVQRMMDACKDAGLPEPEYGTDGLFVWITFKRPRLDTNLDTISDTSSDTNSDTSSDTISDTLILSAKQNEVLLYCMVERSSREILNHINVTYQNKNIQKFINELVDAGLLKRTIPDKPNSPLQKYIKA